MARVLRPTDPLYGAQWYLENTGQAGGAAGNDIDVIRVWADYRGTTLWGTPVRIAVIEGGLIEAGHPDLPALQRQYLAEVDGPPPPGTQPGEHTTAAAGIISGQWNGIGVAGIAPEALLFNYGFEYGSSDDMYARAYQQALADNVWVVNDSWGPTSSCFSYNWKQLGPLSDAVIALAEQGRDGLGAVIVWSNGNGRGEGDDSNLDNLMNNRWVVATAAIDANGVISSYSTPGANLLVSGYGGASTGQSETLPGNGIATTDLTGEAGYNKQPGPAGDYAFGFNGTSAAGPTVAGVVALILSANPYLGWRDVHEILAYSAHITDPSATSWLNMGGSEWNGGGHSFSRDYGFGAVDAHSAVRMAELALAIGQVPRVASNLQSLDLDGSIAGNLASFTASDLRIERIELDLGMNAPNLADLVISLGAPDGSWIPLVADPRSTVQVDYSNPANSTVVPWPTEGFVLDTPAFWGKNAAGTWRISVMFGDEIVPDVLTGAKLHIYGSSWSEDSTYVYTDDFAFLTGRDPGRLVLDDATGVNTINAAALSTAVHFDLAAGTQSLGGQTITFAPGTRVANIWAGDGDDTLLGDDGDNQFYGGRGADFIDGRDGCDTVIYLGSRNQYNISVGADGKLQVHDLHFDQATDTLLNIDLLRFQEGTACALDMTDAALAIASLYGVLLDRAPDRPGFDSWKDLMQQPGGQGLTLDALVRGFLGSTEYQGHAGTLSNAEFITDLYAGFFNRAPDSEGFACWTSVLDYGVLTRAQVVAGFVEALEFEIVTIPELAKAMADGLVDHWLLT